MTFQCRLKIKSHVSKGDMTIGEELHSLSKKIYEYEFTSSGSKEKILSLKNLAPGLGEGVELISCEIDGFLLSNPEEFTSFQMIGNPYIDNRLIKEKKLVFNGDLEFEIDKDKLFWFSYYYSASKIDFVYYNNLATCQGVEGCWSGEETEHTDQYLNVPWHPSVKPEANSKFALGCSMTYGTAVDRTLVWPTLVGYDNFGVPGAGVDSIFYNAHRLVELFRPESIIIMFPDMSRRLLEFEKRGHFFRIPIIPTTISEDILPATLNGDNYWIDKKEIKNLIKQKWKQMVLDENNDHSKYYLKKIADLSCDIHVSSWSPETYEILPNYFEKILPFFERLDLALDNQHPGPISHKNWVDKLKNHNI